MGTEESIITILTPTFNRRIELKALYRSLCSQTAFVFDWLIVDDGSTDDTAETVERWKGDAPFEIRYLHKENGGKDTALNLGMIQITAPLTFIVDSDDTLTPDAVETVCSYYKKYQPLPGSRNIGGFCFLRADSEGEVNAGRFPVNESISDYCESRINAGIAGDKAEVFLTEVLKKYPFQEFEGERYLPEDAVWMQMSAQYTLVNINRVIYVCDYLEGGLTRTGRRMKIRSPYGMMYRSAVYLRDPRVNRKTRCKMMLLYRIYSHFASDQDAQAGRTEAEQTRSRELVSIQRTGLYHFMKLPAFLLYLRWKRVYC